MQINEELIRKVIEEVLSEVVGASAPKNAPASAPLAAGAKVRFSQGSKAVRGTDPREVIVALPPAFGDQFQETIIKVPHAEVLRQVAEVLEGTTQHHGHIL